MVCRVSVKHIKGTEGKVNFLKFSLSIVISTKIIEVVYDKIKDYLRIHIYGGYNSNPADI